MSESTTYESTICLDTGDVCGVHPAIFTIEVEVCPAESHPDGPSHGTEIYSKAKLLRAQLGGLELDRDMCIAAIGAEKIYEQEEKVAEQYLEALSMGDAA